MASCSAPWRYLAKPALVPDISPSLGEGYRPPPRRACAPRASFLPPALPIQRAQGGPVRSDPVGIPVEVLVSA